MRLHFGIVPGQIEIGQEESVPVASILEVVSRKLPIQAKNILGSRGCFFECL